MEVGVKVIQQKVKRRELPLERLDSFRCKDNRSETLYYSLKENKA
jgi:hypothetical protein